jgi:D-3-phosphoglycerate dehydrogenase
VLLGSPANAAVNAPVPDGPEAERVLPFLDVAYRMGRFYPQFAHEPQLPHFALTLQGELAEVPPEPLVRAFLSGLLQTTTDRRVSVVNADAIAAELGVYVDARGERGTSIYASSLRITGGSTSLTGTSVSGVARIVEVDGYEIDATPIGAMLITQHRDVPGMIGRVGTLLGQQNVNISTMQVSRNAIGGDAIMVLSIDRPVEEETLRALRVIPGINSVRSLAI